MGRNEPQKFKSFWRIGEWMGVDRIEMIDKRYIIKKDDYRNVE